MHCQLLASLVRGYQYSHCSYSLHLYITWALINQVQQLSLIKKTISTIVVPSHKPKFLFLLLYRESSRLKMRFQDVGFILAILTAQCCANPIQRMFKLVSLPDAYTLWRPLSFLSCWCDKTPNHAWAIVMMKPPSAVTLSSPRTTVRKWSETTKPLSAVTPSLPRTTRRKWSEMMKPPSAVILSWPRTMTRKRSGTNEVVLVINQAWISDKDKVNQQAQRNNYVGV